MVEGPRRSKRQGRWSSCGQQVRRRRVHQLIRVGENGVTQSRGQRCMGGVWSRMLGKWWCRWRFRGGTEALTLPWLLEQLAATLLSLTKAQCLWRQVITVWPYRLQWSQKSDNEPAAKSHYTTQPKFHQEVAHAGPPKWDWCWDVCTIDKHVYILAW